MLTLSAMIYFALANVIQVLRFYFFFFQIIIMNFESLVIPVCSEHHTKIVQLLGFSIV